MSVYSTDIITSLTKSSSLSILPAPLSLPLAQHDFPYAWISMLPTFQMYFQSLSADPLDSVNTTTDFNQLA